MKGLSGKVSAGLMILRELAIYDAPRPLSLGSISESMGVSVSYLEQIASLLKKADLIDSRRGPGGGYLLSRNASQITIPQVADAVLGMNARAVPEIASVLTPMLSRVTIGDLV